MSDEPKPSVLFVCAKNAGKSQMAAGLMRKVAGEAVDVYSAGTRPGEAINSLSAQALDEVGVDITAEAPKRVDQSLLRDADVVVILGSEAQLDAPPGVAVQRWDTDEPSLRGIDGIDRMRLVRDDIDNRVRRLLTELNVTSEHS
jgi:arsenate-mycothiol transferase